jgi:hypothetical protein
MVLVIELATIRTATELVVSSSAVHPADRIETRIEPGTGLAYTIAGTPPERTSACGVGKTPR